VAGKPEAEAPVAIIEDMIFDDMFEALAHHCTRCGTA
jgi:hypothetical protein